MEENIYNIDTMHLMNPEELLVYYLYKYSLDLKEKKEGQIKEDVYFIKKYAEMLGITLEELDVH